MELSVPIGAMSVVLDCNPRLRDEGDAVLRTLAELDRQGAALRDGSKVQFGWTILTLQSAGGGLRLYEPDYLGDALHGLNANLDLTLDVMTEQVRVLRGEGCDGIDARFDGFVLARRGAIDAEHIFMTRRDPTTEEDTGWFLGELARLGDEAEDAEKEELDTMHVFELLKRRRSVLQALALPPGYAVVMRGDEIDSIMSGEGNR